MEVKESLGIAIRNRRRSLSLSQEELGNRAGLHRTYVGSIERGERNITLFNMFRLARALETTPVNLIEEVSVLELFQPQRVSD